MDRREEKAAPSETAPYGYQDPILVTLDRGLGTPALIMVEWRDGAGELHHADLGIGPDDPWAAGNAARALSR